MKSFGSRFKVSFTFASLVALMAVSFIAFVANAQETMPGDAGPPEETEADEGRGPSMGRGTATPARATATPAAERGMPARAEERRAALTARAQERIENLAANISNRMDAVVFRFERIIERLRSRMGKLEDAGVDTSTASGLLGAAEGSLNEAAAELTNIDTVVAEVVASETPRQAWQRARAVYQSVKEHLRATHTSLRATVAELKAAVAEAEFGSGVSEAVRNDGNATGTNGEEEDDTAAESE